MIMKRCRPSFFDKSAKVMVLTIRARSRVSCPSFKSGYSVSKYAATTQPSKLSPKNSLLSLPTDLCINPFL